MDKVDVPMNQIGKGRLRISVGVFADQGRIIHFGHLLNYWPPKLKTGHLF